jgi:hypothetical protein
VSAGLAVLSTVVPRRWCHHVHSKSTRGSAQIIVHSISTRNSAQIIVSVFYILT